MIIDAHIHCSGAETEAGVLETLDAAEVDVAILLAPFLSHGYRLGDRAALRRANEYLAALVKGHEDRLIGFAVVDPSLPGADDDARRAAETHGLRGLKLVPSGWYPHGEEARRVYAVAEELGLPVLFHSGIFIDGRSGRFCRPVYYEAVRDYPKLRVTLAHLGWPWCDEAIAVGLIDLINGASADECQFRFDISFGAPPVYRRSMLEKALAVLTPGLLQFGSDRFLPCDASELISARAEVERLLDELNIASQDRHRLMAGTARAWLGIGEGRA